MAPSSVILLPPYHTPLSQLAVKYGPLYALSPFTAIVIFFAVSGSKTVAGCTPVEIGQLFAGTSTRFGEYRTSITRNLIHR